MKLKYIALLTLFVFIFNCNSNNEIENSNLIIGEWTLLETISGFGGTPQSYNIGDVTYHFNSDNTLEISSNISEFESVNSTYEIDEDCQFQDCINGNIVGLLIIGMDETNFLITLDETNLKFGTNAFDGTDFIFERID
ncbi:MAG: hypothetical protein EVB11_11650 [Winogradskyella sp.]|nr:MAG: hypothetical protein EVB11_11650 [Winogradskyella sp.]